MGTNNDSNAAGSFVLGVLVGGAIGAVAALLLAPQKGEETRAFIADRSTEFANTARVKSGEFADVVKQNATQISDKTAETVDMLKTRSTEVAASVADRANGIAA